MKRLIRNLHFGDGDGDWIVLFCKNLVEPLIIQAKDCDTRSKGPPRYGIVFKNDKTQICFIKLPRTGYERVANSQVGKMNSDL